MPWRSARRSHSHKKSRKRTATVEIPKRLPSALAAFNCCKNEAAHGEVKNLVRNFDG